jgi:hypothetical protein
VPTIVPVEDSNAVDACGLIKSESNPPAMGVLRMAESVGIAINAIVFEVRGRPGV